MTIVVLWVWLAATLAHFVLTARAVRRFLPTGAHALDERAFATMLGGVGALSCVLHLVALAGGLTLWRVLAALGLWHVALWAVPSSRPPDVAAEPRQPVHIVVAQLLAVAVLAGVLMSWLDHASRSSGISGADAAHYHVPVAVNLALGASPFDLPATQHLYPMAGSVLDAWFILPLSTPLLVDLAMALPFLLLAASIGWLFRLVTGLSGLAWASWLVLLLFSTPLFRESSLVSADLWFTSAFVATTAVFVSVLVRGVWRPVDLVLGSLAVGLLLGVKTTGAAAAFLLVVAWFGAVGAGLVFGRRLPTLPAARTMAVAGASALAFCAGGVWIARNWWMFGSPVAPSGLAVLGVSVFDGEPWGPTTYLSVLGDIEQDPAYDLPGRTARAVRVWIGPWFLPALWMTALVPIDLAIARFTSVRSNLSHARWLAAYFAFAVGGILIALLLGAPWTSLEWTRGLSLRYALPVAVFIPFLAFVGLFPLTWRWYEFESIAPSGVAVCVGMSALAFYVGLDERMLRYVEVPPVTVPWLVAGLAASVCGRWFAARFTLAGFAALLAIVVVSALWVPSLAARAGDERRRFVAEEETERAAFAENTVPTSAGRRAYLTVLAAEDAAARRCGERRFFLLTRFDEPLTLQSATYRNTVFYAARDTDRTGRAGPIGECDYIVATRDVMGTVKGAALVTALAAGAPVVEVGAADPFVILRRGG